MGLLDDAIREHLELKRRRGADPSEIARQEGEAFGPVRREADSAPVDEVAPGTGEYADDLEPVGFEDDDSQEPSGAVPFETDTAEGHDEPRYPDPEPAVSRYDDPEPAEPRYADPEPESFAPEPVEPEPVHEEPAATPEPPPVAPEPDPVSFGQPTAEFAADDLADALGEAPPPAEAVPDEPVPDEEDELAETPEFLQETPEHDRLWFEQKPPKDFDF